MKPYKVIAMPWRAECSRPLLATFRFVRFPRERNVFFHLFQPFSAFFPRRVLRRLSDNDNIEMKDPLGRISLVPQCLQPLLSGGATLWNH